MGLWAVPAATPQAANSGAPLAARHGGPVDLAVANEEKLAEMLKKSGKLRADATPAEAEAAVRAYLKQKAAHTSKEKGELHEYEAKRADVLREKGQKNSILNGKGKKLGQTKKDSVPSVKPEAWNGGKRVDRVLVLLIEYPDFPHNRIQPNETDMYYKDYTREHYEDMIFGGDDGYYAGPNGEKLISVKKSIMKSNQAAAIRSKEKWRAGIRRSIRLNTMAATCRPRMAMTPIRGRLCARRWRRLRKTRASICASLTERIGMIWMATATTASRTA